MGECGGEGADFVYDEDWQLVSCLLDKRWKREVPVSVLLILFVC